MHASISVDNDRLPVSLGMIWSQGKEITLPIGIIEREGHPTSKGEEMGSFPKIKNVGGGEAIFRFLIGIFLIISALFISGGFRWVPVLIGVALILTAIFGY